MFIFNIWFLKSKTFSETFFCVRFRVFLKHTIAQIKNNTYLIYIYF